MEWIAQILAAAAGSPWALAALAGLLVCDGFVPLLPAEALVVGVAAAMTAAGGDPWWMLAAAAPAAVVGALIAYWLGRRLNISEWRAMRRPAVAAVFRYAQRRLASRPASMLVSAKFLPVARIVVPMTAGAERMPLRRFLPLTVISVLAYLGFHVAVGAAAATWLPNPAVALGCGVAAAVALGLVLDLAAKGLARARVRAQLRKPPERSARSMSVV